MASASSSSASTHKSTLMKSRKGTLMKSREGDDDDGESTGGVKPALFDRLPDGIILEVLTHVLPRYYQRRATPRPLVVNKHIYGLSSRLCASTVLFSEITPGILRRPDLFGVVKHLEYWASRLHPQAIAYEGFVLRLFPNLTSLTVELAHESLEYSVDWDDDTEDETDGWVGISGFPVSLTDSLRTLKHLRHLRIELASPWRFEDETFSIARDLPHLRSIAINKPPSGLRELFTPLPTLFRLELAYAEDAETYQLVPWSSLESLSLRFVTEGAASVYPLREFNHTLEKALFPTAIRNVPVKLALRRFVLSDLLLPKISTAEHDTWSASVAHLFRLLAATACEEVMFNFSVIMRGPEGLSPIPSVRRLTMQATVEGAVSTSADTDKLLQFLTGFPALHHLEADGFIFSTDVSEATRAALDPAGNAFLSRHPTVSSLLEYLRRRSPVLSFRWRCDHYGRESYVWVRSTADEAFQVDRYYRPAEEEEG